MKYATQATLGAVGVTTTAALVLAAGLSTDVNTHDQPVRLDAAQQTRVNPGHPSLEDILEMGLPFQRGAGGPDPFPDPDDPHDSPLESGAFVNFESPLIVPAVLSSDGSKLYVTNTPNNRVVEIDTTGVRLAITREFPVGLDPVALALRSDNELWVSNRLSDNITVIDLNSGETADIIDVGDEPGVILFNATGNHAFVVCQGPPLAGAGDAIDEKSGLVAINTTTHNIVGTHILNMNGGRAATYDPTTDTIAVASLLSGNNTYAAGQPVIFELLIDPDDPGAGTTNTSFPDLVIGQLLSLTAPIFTAGGSGGLGEWPDPSAVPATPAPFVMRIVPDSGVTTNNPWGDIINVISDGTGNPDPVALAQWELENPTHVNAFDTFVDTINDVKDTLDNDVEVVDVSSPAAMTSQKIVANVGTTLPAMARNPVTGDLFVLSIDANNVTRLEPNHQGVFIDHELTIIRDINTASPTLDNSDLNAGIPNFDDPSVFNPDAHADAISNPSAIIFTPSGGHAFVLGHGSNKLAALDGVTGAVLDRIDVGKGPRGLAFDPVTSRVYTVDRTAMTVSVVNAFARDSLILEETFSLFNPEPAVITDGRNFLYSTEFSNLNRASCATCHIDSTLDGLAWDLGNHTKTTVNDKPHIVIDLFGNPCLDGNGINHPVKGPMVTQSLQGLDRHDPFHWRGDKPEFQDFNGAFEDLLGGDQLDPADMDRYADFIMTVAYPPNPHRTRDNVQKDANAINGRGLIINSCDRCHELSHDGALTVEDECNNITGDSAFNLNGLFAQLQMVPHFRDLRRKFHLDKYTGFGMVHDGRDEAEDKPSSMHEFLSFFFGFGPLQQDEGAAYILSINNNVMPIVGAQVLATDTLQMQPAPVQQGAQQQVFGQPVPAPETDWPTINLMLQQSALIPSRNDVVVKGLVGGAQRGWWLIANDPATLYRSDVGTIVSHQDLVDLVAAGNRLTWSAVPPGSGRRIGIDQDNDCLSDGLDDAPQLARKHADFNGDNFVGSGDMALLLGTWGTSLSQFDLDNSGSVGAGDLASVLGSWGACQ